MDPDDKTFPSLGDPPFPVECRDAAVAELRAAGVPRGSEEVTAREVYALVKGSDAEQAASAGIYIPSAVASAPKEWVTVYCVEARAFGWRFSRAWHYWVASSESMFKEVPLATAAALHEKFGQAVRVGGHCGCPAPKKSVDCYHVDTPAGLAALVEVLKGLQEDRDRARQAELRGRADV